MPRITLFVTGASTILPDFVSSTGFVFLARFGAHRVTDTKTVLTYVARLAIATIFAGTAVVFTFSFQGVTALITRLSTLVDFVLWAGVLFYFFYLVYKKNGTKVLCVKLRKLIFKKIPSAHLGND